MSLVERSYQILFFILPVGGTARVYRKSAVGFTRR
jgi:hypothetical protein